MKLIRSNYTSHLNQFRRLKFNLLIQIIYHLSLSLNHFNYSLTIVNKAIDYKIVNFHMSYKLIFILWVYIVILVFLLLLSYFHFCYCFLLLWTVSKLYITDFNEKICNDRYKNFCKLSQIYKVHFMTNFDWEVSEIYIKYLFTCNYLLDEKICNNLSYNICKLSQIYKVIDFSIGMGGKDIFAATFNYFYYIHK